MSINQRSVFIPVGQSREIYRGTGPGPITIENRDDINATQIIRANVQGDQCIARGIRPGVQCVNYVTPSGELQRIQVQVGYRELDISAPRPDPPQFITESIHERIREASAEFNFFDTAFRLISEGMRTEFRRLVRNSWRNSDVSRRGLIEWESIPNLHARGYINALQRVVVQVLESIRAIEDGQNPRWILDVLQNLEDSAREVEDDRSNDILRANNRLEQLRQSQDAHSVQEVEQVRDNHIVAQRQWGRARGAINQERLRREENLRPGNGPCGSVDRYH